MNSKFKEDLNAEDQFKVVRRDDIVGDGAK